MSQADDAQPRAGKSERRRRTAVVSVRMTEDELRAVEALAAGLGKPVGAVLRECALAAAQPPPAPEPSGRRVPSSLNRGTADSRTGSLHFSVAGGPGPVNV